MILCACALVPTAAVAATADEIALLPTLDALNRTETPLSNGGKWAALNWSGGTQKTGQDSTSGWIPYDGYSIINGAYWAPRTFKDAGAGAAAAITMQTSPANENRYLALWLDMGNPGSTKSGYQLRWIMNPDGSTYTVKLSKWAAGVETELAKNTSVTIATGTTLAISDVGGTVTAWKSSGSTFTSLLSASDSTYSEGYSGIEGSGNLSRSINFKAGVLPGSAIPAIATVDSLKRTEDPLSNEGKWKLLNWAAKTGHALETGWSSVSSFPTADGAYWSPLSSSDAGGDAAAVTMATGPGYEERSQAIWLNMPSPGSAKSGYRLFWEVNLGYAGYTLKLSKFSAGTETVLAKNTSASIPNGTTLALADTGGTVTAWQGSGNSLGLTLSASDSTYSEGYAGIEGVGGLSPRLVDFKAGSFVPPPDTTITSGPSGLVFPDVSFTFSSPGATFECSLDGGAYGSCASPKEYTALAEGSHTFRVRAKDIGGVDPTPAERTFEVIGVGKAVSKVALRDDFERNEEVLTAPNWSKTSWGENGAVTKGSGYHSYSGFGAAHYWNPETFSDDEDGPAVVSTIVGGTATASGQQLALWLAMPTPTGAKSGYEARFAGNGSTAYTATLSKWVSGAKTVLASKFGTSIAVGETIVLVDFGGQLELWSGTSSFSKVLAAGDSVYSSGNAGLEVTGVYPYQHHFRAGNIDQQAPDTSIISGPSGKVLPDVSFSFTSTESGSTFECSIDGGAYASCTSPKTYKALSEGSHTFKVRATDNVGNQDASPAERSFEVYDPPETTITSRRPSYTGAETWPVEFSSDEKYGSFECTWGSGWYPCVTGEPLPDPKKLLFQPGDGWYTYRVAAKDFSGYKDPTPAEWRVHFGPYPPAPVTSKLTSPEEGHKSSHYYTLKAEWGSAPEGGGVTGVTFQIKLPEWKEFKAVPAKYVLDGAGKEVSWPLTAASNPGHTEPVFFDYLTAGKTEKWPLYEEDVKFRAVFDGGQKAAGASEPATTEFLYEYGGVGAPTDAVAQVGPASVDLLTGQYTISRIDVSIPVPGSEASLEFTRTYESNFRNQKVPALVLGGMWQPSAPVEQAYQGETWAELRERHQDAVPAQYDPECIAEWEEEGQGFPKEECLVEEAIPAADWIELLANEGGESAAATFEISGGSYIAPDYMKEYVLTKVGETFELADPEGVRTTFVKNDAGLAGSYRPNTVSWQATAKSARMVYEHPAGTGEYRLAKMIAPAPTGVTCGDETSISTPGCRTLTFQYSSCNCVGWSRLSSITYYNASGNTGTAQKVAEYEYDAEYRLIAEWDPRISPNLKEKYGYDKSYKLQTLTPPGEEPWSFSYYSSSEFSKEGQVYNWKDAALFDHLKSVSRASLLQSPSTATTTIAYQVPVSGSGAPYDMSPATVAKWGQSDYPVDATAIFPPTQVPGSPRPTDFSKATVHYMDPDGYEVNTASPQLPGASGPSISTSEVDTKGNPIRSLSPQNRLTALAATDTVTRSKELDSHSVYNSDGTRMLESWGPLHKVRLESGETVEARAHTTVEYDKGFTKTKEEEPWPNLPTKETTGAAIAGKADADVQISETKYDWTLRKPTESIVDPSGLNIITKTAYNSAGQVTAEIQPSNEGKDNATGVTITEYYVATGKAKENPCFENKAWAGLPCKVGPAAPPSPAESNPQMPSTWFTKYSNLDEPEELQEKTNGVLKRTTTFTYDSVGRSVKTKMTSPEGTSIPAVETTYKESTGVPEKQQFVCEAPENCTGFDNQQLTTTYDTLGRITSYTDADGNKSTISYDAYGHPFYIYDGKASQTTTYDEKTGLPTKIIDSAAGTLTATYNANGQMTEQILPNGVAQQITYDVTGTAVGLKYKKISGCESGCTWLEFNREDSIGGQVLRETGTLATKEYSYDKAGRLSLAKETPAGQGCTTRAYAFDKDSNRTSRITRAPKEGGACDTTSEGTKTSYSYDTADRLIGSGVVYDSLGRITSLPSTYSGGGTLTTSYYVNDLTRSQTQDGLTNTYYLDSALRQRERVQSGSKSGTEIYHYAGSSDSPAWTQEGANWTRNIAAMSGSLGALQKSNGEITFQIADMHGDIVGIADDDPSATKLLSTQQFDEFGNPKQSNTPKFGWLGAKSRRTELPSGVVQMGVRSYVPAMGRFLSPDPIPGGSANAYDYANQDPVNNFDLTGECPRPFGSGCLRDAVRKYKRRAHRKAREHGLRRLAHAHPGGGAHASILSVDLGFALSALQGDVADVAGDPGVGALARTAAGYAVHVVRNYAEARYKSARQLAMRTIRAMKAAGDWSWEHRSQIYECLTGAYAAFLEAPELTAAGPAGDAALGLYMAVNCGVAFVPE